MGSLDSNFAGEPDLDLSGQSEVASFLSQFGGEFLLDAAAMQNGIHTSMKEARIQLEEHLVRTGDIPPEAAAATLEAIDIAVDTDREFTHDTLRELLEELRADVPHEELQPEPDWEYPRLASEDVNGVTDDWDPLDDETACLDADMFGIYSMEDPTDPGFRRAA